MSSLSLWGLAGALLSAGEKATKLASTFKKPIKINLDNAKKALEDYKIKIEQVRKAQEKLDQKSNEKNENAKKKAIDERTDSLRKLGEAIGLNSDQTEQLLHLNTDSEQLTDILTAVTNGQIKATEGLTLAKLAESKADMVKMILDGRSQKDGFRRILALGAERLSVKALAIEQKGENKTILEGLAAKAMDVVASRLAEISNYGLAASIWAVAWPILAVVAALALVLVGWKHLKKFSPDGQMKAAAEATAQAKDAATDAAEQYTQLNDALQELDDKYKTLGTLAKGTREWGDAVADINTSASELIDKYDELAQVANFNFETGVIELDMNSEEVKSVLDAYNAIAQRASTSANVVKVSGSQVKIEQTQRKLDGDLVRMGKNIGDEALQEIAVNWSQGKYGVTEDKQTEELTKALKQYSPDSTDSVIKGWVEAILENSDQLRNFGKTVTQELSEQKLFYSSVVNDTVNRLDKTKYTSEQLTAAQNFGLGLNKQAQLDAAKESADSITDYKDDQDYGDYFRSIYGDKIEVGAGGKITGTDAEGNEVSISKEEARLQYSGKLLSDTLLESQKSFLAALQKAGPNSILAQLYSSASGKSLTMSAAKRLNADEVQKLWNDNADLQKAYGTFEEFNNYVTESLKYVEGVTKQISQLGLKDASIFDNLTGDAASALSDKLYNIIATSGSSAAQEIANNIAEVSRNMTQEQAKSFMAQLNALDWHDLEDLSNFKNTLKELGIAVEDNNLNKLIDNIKNYNKAIYGVDWEVLSKRVETFSKIMKEFTQGSRTIDEDTYAQVSSVADGFFLKNEEGEYVLIKPLKEFTQVIKEATIKIAENTLTTTEARKEAHEDLTNAKINTGVSDLKGMTKTQLELLLLKLQSIIDVNFGSLGIEGLSETTYRNNLSEDKLRELLTELLKLKDEGTIAKDKMDARSAAAQTFGLNTLAENMKQLIEARDDENTDKGAFEFQALIDAIKMQVSASENVPQVLADTYLRLLEDKNADPKSIEALEEYLYKSDLNSVFGWLQNNEKKLDVLAREREKAQRQYALNENTGTMSLETAELWGNTEADSLKQSKAITNAMIKDLQAQLDILTRPFVDEGIMDPNGIIIKSFDELTDIDKASLLATQQEAFDLVDQLNDAKDQLEDIEDEEIALRKRLKDNYKDLADRIKENLIDEMQAQIDALSDLNDAITDGLSKITDKVQEQIDDQRAAREQEKAQQEINDKQQRLAYLMQDTRRAIMQRFWLYRKRLRIVSNH